MLKRSIIVLIFFFVGFSGLYSQSSSPSAVEDAISLVNMLENGKFSDTDRKFIGILRRYVFNESEKNDFKIIQYICVNGKRDNEFLKEFFNEEDYNDSNGKARKADEHTTLFDYTLTSARANNLGFSTIADGIAKFLVERTKEELNTAFFRWFQNEITNNKKYRCLRVLFPRTYHSLLAIDTEIWNYGRFIHTLQEAFKTDLDCIYDKIPVLLNENPFSDYFEGKELYKSILKDASRFIQIIKSGDHPGKILSNIDLDIFKKNSSDLWLKNTRSGFNLLKLLSGSLRQYENGTDSGYWIKRNKLASLLSSQKRYATLRIYLGLLFQQADKLEKNDNKFDDIVFYSNNSTTKFTKILSDIYDKKNDVRIEDYCGFFEKLYYKFSHLIDVIEENRKKAEETPNDEIKLTFNDYYKYYDAVLRIFEYILEFDKLPSIDGQSLAGPRRFMTISRAMGNVYMNIKQKNYRSIPFQVVQIYRNLLPEKNEVKEMKIKDNEKYNEINKIEIVCSKIVRYGSFIADVASAENSDQVKDAINAVVLPAGSSSMKFNSSFSLTLNAYVGACFGRERNNQEEDQVNTNQNNKEQNYISSIGVIAPIGIEFCFGGFSLLASAFDLGAVTAYRFKDNSTEYLPEFKLSNIVAPGLFGIFGHRRMPLSIGVGLQYVPTLREIVSGTELEIAQKRTWRITVLFAVDIPLLKFYSKPK